MRPATVLYEDKMGKTPSGKFAFHEWVLRCVVDEGRDYQALREIRANPRNGVDNVLSDITCASLIAQGGRLFALVDRDRIVDHVNRRSDAQLSRSDTHEVLATKIRKLSDAPESVEVFFLEPNLEGVLRTLERCDRDGDLSAEDLAAALKKGHLARNAVFEKSRAERLKGLRACVRKQQPGIDGLVRAIAAWVAQT